MIKRAIQPIAVTMSLVLLACGCGRGPQGSGGPTVSAAGKTAATSAAAGAAGDPVPTFPSKPASFELSEQDNPCNDFYDYVNAKWAATHPIPADHPSWGAGDELQEKSLQEQRQIVETTAQSADHEKAGSIEQKLGWLYASGMDTAAIDKATFGPIKPQLDAIAKLTRADIPGFIYKRFAEGDSYLFAFASGANFGNAEMQIGFVHQAGLGLPTRDYYFAPQYANLRKAYLAYIAKSLELTGVPTADATKQAAEVMAFETALARASLTPTELRNLDNEYHFVTVAQADKISPHFSWANFFAAQGVTIGNGFSVAQPKFIAAVDSQLAHAPLEQWQAYLQFHTIDAAAPYLSRAFEDNWFDFHGKTLSGQPQQKPRWQRVLGTVNDSMGMALGQLYVARYFPPSAKARAEKLVSDIHEAFKRRIETLPWMSKATKTKALEKLMLFLPKIGYPDPDEWRDWTGLRIVPGNYFTNVEAARKFNYHYDIGKIGKKTDRREWPMTPQTINASYDPETNTITFPAAILQPPFFLASGDDAFNYGGIGAIIGHESTHGFDDQGSQFDGEGNRRNWWTKEDKAEFDARATVLVRQFDAYAPIEDEPNLHVNGHLTLGENIADLGGLNIAYDALQRALAANPELAGEKIQGLTQDQRFFVSWGRKWRRSDRKKFAELMLSFDPHAPGHIRAIAAPSNMPQFAAAFQCTAGDKMVRPAAARVRIW
jgi:putative endopeptidase